MSQKLKHICLEHAYILVLFFSNIIQTRPEHYTIACQMLINGGFWYMYFIKYYAFRIVSCSFSSKLVAGFKSKGFRVSEYELMLKAIVDMLDGAKYLWKG